MTTLAETFTVIYGAAAYGGKIHRTSERGHAFCLSGNGNKPMRSVSARVTHSYGSDWGTNYAAEIAALRAAKINPNNLCRKCASHVAETMQEVSA